MQLLGVHTRVQHGVPASRRPGGRVRSSVEIIAFLFLFPSTRLSHDESVGAGWQYEDHVITVGISHQSRSYLSQNEARTNNHVAAFFSSTITHGASVSLCSDVRVHCRRMMISFHQKGQDQMCSKYRASLKDVSALKIPVDHEA